MGEYLLLIIFVVALATASIWSIRAMKIFGRTCYTALMPGNDDGFLKTWKRVRADADLPSLSEDLRSLPMPWGWKAARQRSNLRREHAVTMIPAGSPASLAPWGWPGHNAKGSEYSLDILSVIAQEQAAPVVQATPVALSQRQRNPQDNAAGVEIRGNRGGGFKLVPARRYDLKDARMPWGW